MIESIPGMTSDASNPLTCVISGKANNPSSGKAALPSRRHNAFTLVELLVVIGIIAILVAVLLPALSKARQQANLIDCQSRLRQMGQAFNIYASETKGFLPWGCVRNDKSTCTWENGNLPNSTDEEYSWFWMFTLSQELQANMISPADGLVHNLSPIFKDVDTIPIAPSFRYVNHYTCNPQIFQNNYDPGYLQDGTAVAQQYKVQRRLSQIRPSNAFLVWDAPQAADWNNNAYEQATCIDCNELTFGSYLFVNTPGCITNYNRCVVPGQVVQVYTQSQCKLLEIKENVDLPVTVTHFTTHLRFRHLGNTTMNALCADGHVETRNPGTFMVLDVAVQTLQD
jgi:prepilin-type N-terminal cleavage/methylation domain-containing protein